MHICLKSFESLTDSPWARNLPIVLLLNKFDSFDMYDMYYGVLDNFPDCPRDVNSVGACEFLKAKFASLDQRPEGRLQIHITSAVDPILFKETWHEFRDILTRTTGNESLEASSLKSSEERRGVSIHAEMIAEPAN